MGRMRVTFWAGSWDRWLIALVLCGLGLGADRRAFS